MVFVLFSGYKIRKISSIEPYSTLNLNNFRITTNNITGFKPIFGSIKLRGGLKNKTFSLWERFLSFRNWKNKTCFDTSHLYRKLRNWKYKTYSSQKIRNWKNKTFSSRLMFYSFNFLTFDRDEMYRNMFYSFNF